jgi:hypothetical protein
MKLSDATGMDSATPGIDPGTFRHVARHLNHYATPGPHARSMNAMLLYRDHPHVSATHVVIFRVIIVSIQISL